MGFGIIGITIFIKILLNRFQIIRLLNNINEKIVRYIVKHQSETIDCLLRFD